MKNVTLTVNEFYHVIRNYYLHSFPCLVHFSTQEVHPPYCSEKVFPLNKISSDALCHADELSM